MRPSADQGLCAISRKVSDRYGGLGAHCLGQLEVALMPVRAQYPHLRCSFVLTNDGTLILSDGNSGLLSTRLLGVSSFSSFIDSRRRHNLNPSCSIGSPPNDNASYLCVSLNLRETKPGTIVGNFAVVDEPSPPKGAYEYQTDELIRPFPRGGTRSHELPAPLIVLTRRKEDELISEALRYALNSDCPLSLLARLANTLNHHGIESRSIIQTGIELCRDTVSTEVAYDNLLNFAMALHLAGNDAHPPLRSAFLVAQLHTDIVKMAGLPTTDLLAHSCHYQPSILVELFAVNDFLEEARSLSIKLSSIWELRSLIMAYVRKDRIADAETLADKFELHTEKTAVYGCLVASLIHAGKPHEDALKMALDFARKARYEPTKGNSLLQIVGELMIEKCDIDCSAIIDEAQRIFEQLGDSEHLQCCYTCKAIIDKKFGRDPGPSLAKALELAKKTTSFNNLTQTFLDLEANTDQLRSDLKTFVAEKREDPSKRLEALISLVVLETITGTDADGYFRELLTAIDGLPTEQRELSATMAEVGLSVHPKTLGYASTIEQVFGITDSLTHECAERYLAEGDTTKALTFIGIRYDDPLFIDILEKLAQTGEWNDLDVQLKNVPPAKWCNAAMAVMCGLIARAHQSKPKL